MFMRTKGWRRGSESNRRIKVLQTSPLPLGYRALSNTLAFRAEKVYLRGNAGSREKLWSGRRDLNPRLRPWQGRTLPLSYSRSASSIINDVLRWSNDYASAGCSVHGPLRIFLRAHQVAVAHVNDAVSVFGGLGIVGNHQHRLA